MRCSQLARRPVARFGIAILFTALVGTAAPGQAAHTMPAAPVTTASPQDDSTLIAGERAMWNALQERDTLAFQRAMRSVVDVDLSGIRRTTPASLAQYVTQCTLASHSLTDFHVTRDSLVAVLTYKAVVDQTCWGQKAPSPLNVMSVFERQPSGWVAIAHSETPASHW